MAEETDEASEREGWERLDWEKAVEHPMTPDGFRLVVDGESEVPMAKVEIHVTPIGIVPDDYHPAIVQGRRREPVTQVKTPWIAEKNTNALALGRIGYVLIGATMRQYFPPKDDDGGEDSAT
jgi:hypothetical protein